MSDSSSPPPPPHRGRSISTSGELPPGEDWRDYRRAILDDLRELKKENRELRDLLLEQAKSITSLTTKVSLYAAGFGAVASAIVAIAVEVITKSFGH